MIVTTECIRGRVFTTRAEANLALFEYIDGFYNSRLTADSLLAVHPCNQLRLFH
ncbi:integrase core domain-containing protein [Streptomyces sp. NBC_00457]|uniref:IS3 family transposase n=1 Tax=unclassified Streptomyces TaxID=2593676 RepID=UPI002E20ACFA|nr:MULTISPECIES: IS3 family transposase [unclassified Streptomyces]